VKIIDILKNPEIVYIIKSLKKKYKKNFRKEDIEYILSALLFKKYDKIKLLQVTEAINAFSITFEMNGERIKYNLIKEGY
jgi:hypothetical protein